MRIPAGRIGQLNQWLMHLIVCFRNETESKRLKDVTSADKKKPTLINGVWVGALLMARAEERTVLRTGTFLTSRRSTVKLGNQNAADHS